MTAPPITRVVLYKHGVGHFTREGAVDGDTTLSLTFKQSEVSDVLKSLTVLDLNGGHIATVSYDSTKPLEQLLADVALAIPDKGSVVGLLPQIKGARVAVHSGVADPVEGSLLGIDTTERQTGDGVLKIVLVSLLTDNGSVRSFDLHGLASLQILDGSLRRDLDYYLRTQLSSKKKDSRTFTFFAQGQGQRGIRLSYTLAAPVWKATYRILLGEEGKPPMIQGWAVVDNTQDEDWDNVQLALISGLPVSFTHDLYTPRYIRRPEVQVRDTTGVLPPVVEDGVEELTVGALAPAGGKGAGGSGRHFSMRKAAGAVLAASVQESAASSMPAQVRERQLGDLFEYAIEHPVSIRRNQSALVPIVLRAFEGRPVLLYNKDNRPENPMRCVELKNTTGLTLEGGPVTVLEAGSYVGEAMLEITKPDDERLVPYAVELGVRVLFNLDSHEDTANRVVIRNRILTTFQMQSRQTTYTFDNKSPTETTLYLEHRRPGQEWELFDTPAPRMTTANYWRFMLMLPGRQVTRFVVRERYLTEHANGLIYMNPDLLGLWMQQRYLDARTAEVLREVVALQGKTAEAEGLIERLEKERQTIHAEQERIRQNLQALADRSAEKELRERFVRTLNSQEDRLEEIARDVRKWTEAKQQSLERINVLLGQLEYDGKPS